jgi:two-component sensor histidine kinase/DNA-binding response OmpR family regulator
MIVKVNLEKANLEKVNVLLVDDQPEKLLAYEVILGDLNENLVKASSAREALTFLLKNDVAVVLVDVCMPELDGFQLAEMIREHPRFQKTAIIFISAIQVEDVDRLRGYELGAVDYVPVPVVPDLLRAKVRVFADLFRKTRQLEKMNLELEGHIAERTAELAASNARLLQIEQGRSLALAAGQMGSWEWEVGSQQLKWDEGQYRIFGVDPHRFTPTIDNVRGLLHPEEWDSMQQTVERMSKSSRTQQTEFRVLRPNGETRWCTGTAAASVDANGKVTRVSGVTIDITDRKEAEERQTLLAREVDHRARNALAVIQSIIRLTRAKSVDDYVTAIEGRIKALARAHTLLSDSRWNGADLATLVGEELAPYRTGDKVSLHGPDISLQPSTAQGLALALHELATNAAKHGALSSINGKLSLTWQLGPDALVLEWTESGGPLVAPPTSRSFGLRVIRASVEQQLNGEATFRWERNGLCCRFSIPRREAMKAREAAAAPQLATLNGSGAGLKVSGRPRVLLVEDEALVAMMIQECLSDFGYQVVGPISTATEAAVRATDGNFEAAVLDINLGDGAVYPIADMLAARGVPFVFVTGYDAESVDARFRDVPVLQKPIERDVLQRIFVVAAKAAVAG